jgi:hypothetical protein
MTLYLANPNLHISRFHTLATLKMRTGNHQDAEIFSLSTEISFFMQKNRENRSVTDRKIGGKTFPPPFL